MTKTEDIEKIFYPKTDIESGNSKEILNNIDYINYISLSSDDHLLNTLFENKVISFFKQFTHAFTKRIFFN